MNRYFLEIAYKGTSYHGWQKQTKQPVTTIQGMIENALPKILINTEPQIVGASRTDAGVHARQTFAHFHREKPPPESFLPRINSYLPSDILIKRVFQVSPKTHARFDAIARSYEYIICTRKNPFMEGFAYNMFHVKDLEIKKMQKCAKFLQSQKDFAAFGKTNSSQQTSYCDIKEARWVHYKDRGQLIFYITANRFLRGMVRGIVGTLLKVGRGKYSVEEFKTIVTEKQKQKAKFDTPPQGLYLMEVRYPFKFPKV